MASESDKLKLADQRLAEIKESREMSEKQLLFMKSQLVGMQNKLSHTDRKYKALSSRAELLEQFESMSTELMSRESITRGERATALIRETEDRARNHLSELVQNRKSRHSAIEHLAAELPRTAASVLGADTLLSSSILAPPLEANSGSNAPRAQQQKQHCVNVICSKYKVTLKLAHGFPYLFSDLLEDVCTYWGLLPEKYTLQTDYSAPCPLSEGVEEWLLDIAVGTRVSDERKPRPLEARETFKWIDADESGEIDQQEFERLFLRLSQHSKDGVPELFRAIDADRSGVITFAEFNDSWALLTAFLRRDVLPGELPVVYLIPRRRFIGETAASALQHDSGPRNLDAATVAEIKMSPALAFEMFDRAARGSVDFKAFRQVFRELGSEMTNKEIYEVFRKVNVDGSGVIDFGEFEQSWAYLVQVLAEQGTLLDADDVLEELGDTLGLQVFKTHLSPLPQRHSALVRRLTVFLAFLALFLWVFLSSRDLQGSWLFADSVQGPTIADAFAGPPPRFFSTSLFNSSVVDAAVAAATSSGGAAAGASLTNGGSLTTLHAVPGPATLPTFVRSGQFWGWALGPFLQTLGSAAPPSIPESNNPGPDGHNRTYINYYSRGVGELTLQQRRYQPVTCPAEIYGKAELIRANYGSCRTLSPAVVRVPGLNLRNSSVLQAAMRALVNGTWSWVDDDTAEILISGVIYNPNVNLFLWFTYTLTNSASGAWSTDYLFRIIKIDVLSTEALKIGGVLQAVLAMFVLYFLAGEAQAYKACVIKYGNGRRYFRSVPNLLSLSIALLFILSAALRITFFFFPPRSGFDLLAPTTLSPPEAATIFRLYVLPSYVDSGLVWLALFRVLHFFTASDNVGFMWRVLGKASLLAATYSILFALLMLAFILFAHVLFGVTLPEFRTLGQSFNTMLLMLLRQYDYERVVDADAFWGPLFIIVFFVLMVFLFKNIFIAIVNDSYRVEAQEARMRQPDVVQWSVRAVLGACIPLLRPSTLVLPTHPLRALPAIGLATSRKLHAVGLYTLEDLSTLTDADIRALAPRTGLSRPLHKLRLYRRTARDLIGSAVFDEFDGSDDEMRAHEAAALALNTRRDLTAQELRQGEERKAVQLAAQQRATALDQQLSVGGGGDGGGGTGVAAAAAAVSGGGAGGNGAVAAGASEDELWLSVAAAHAVEAGVAAPLTAGGAGGGETKGEVDGGRVRFAGV